MEQKRKYRRLVLGVAALTLASPFLPTSPGADAHTCAEVRYWHHNGPTSTVTTPGGCHSDDECYGHHGDHGNVTVLGSHGVGYTVCAQTSG